MRWWDRRQIHEPTTSADALVVKRSPRSPKPLPVDSILGGASETLDESTRPVGGCLSIPKLTRYHGMVGLSPDL